MAELTPMMRQYMEMKERNPGCLLFFRLGDFYEMFAEDAKVASKELDLTLTTRDRGKEKEDQTPMCGVPFHSAESYIARLVAKGYPSHSAASCPPPLRSQRKWRSTAGRTPGQRPTQSPGYATPPRGAGVRGPRYSSQDYLLSLAPEVQAGDVQARFKLQQLSVGPARVVVDKYRLFRAAASGYGGAPVYGRVAEAPRARVFLSGVLCVEQQQRAAPGEADEVLRRVALRLVVRGVDHGFASGAQFVYR